MRNPIKYFPKDIQDRYNLNTKTTTTGFVYIEIKKGMNGLKQAAVLANNNLIKNLKNNGYEPIPHTNSNWHHKHYPTNFCLCVDNFGVNVFDKFDLNHLIDSLQKHYKIFTYYSGKNYCGLTLAWNYKDGYVNVSMSGYVHKMLQKIQHNSSTNPQFAPHSWSTPYYGARIQYTLTHDSSPLSDKKGQQFVLLVVSSFLYYGRAIDSTMLVALNDIAAHQAAPTQVIQTKCDQQLDYAAIYLDVKLHYSASDMILHIYLEAVHLVQNGAQSCITGHYIHSSYPHPALHIPKKAPNATISIKCKTLRHVVASAVEAKTGGRFHNAKKISHLRILVEFTGHKQPPTPLKTDNITASAYVCQ